MSQPLKVLMIATSYPRGEADWQGLFIRRIADAMGESHAVELSLWAPDGPRHNANQYTCSSADSRWLADLAERGGIAHLLRSSPLRALFAGGGLLRRLRILYRAQLPRVDRLHVNWLQNALPLYGLNARAVITVLGTDFKLLKVPGMVAMLRQVLKTNRCVLAPNAEWMQPELERLFGDLARVQPVNFGIDDAWYDVKAPAPGPTNHWLSVLRVTSDKIGPLFEWGEEIFGVQQQFHLFGPNQDGLTIPDWINYHGPVSAQELSEQWYPRSVGFITLSEHSEGKPQVLLETMAAGLPVIASDQPAHREAVEQGKQGFLVSSAQGFRDALAQLQLPDVHRGLAENCRSRSAAEYGSWADCLGRYQRLYEELE